MTEANSDAAKVERSLTSYNIPYSRSRACANVRLQLLTDWSRKNLPTTRKRGSPDLPSQDTSTHKKIPRVTQEIIKTVNMKYFSPTYTAPASSSNLDTSKIVNLKYFK